MTGAWWDSAACKDRAADTFFPDVAHRGAYKLARAVCADCPVRQACLEDALSRNERYGIWGGKTTRERDKYARNATPVPTVMPTGCDGLASGGQYYRETRNGGKPCEQCRLAYNARRRARSAVQRLLEAA